MASQRPLEQIRREARTAERAPHLRKKNIVPTDQIDALDDIGIGGAYHHDGPYEATLASRNRDKRYAPVEAVKETNRMAIQATPDERIRDSLIHHVPLHGTAEIPPGGVDMFGRVMDYEEGADVMRDADAPGGAYRRYEGRVSSEFSWARSIQRSINKSGLPETTHADKYLLLKKPYHPDDLKGKGEPSFTIERDEKQRKRRHAKSQSQAPGYYEMQPQASRPAHKNGDVLVRQRSKSSSTYDAPAYPHDAGISRSLSTSQRISGGIKRRFGSLHRHNDVA